MKNFPRSILVVIVSSPLFLSTVSAISSTSIYKLEPESAVPKQDIVATSSNDSNNVIALTLNECQELAMRNYPLVKSLDLIKQSGEYSVSNAKSGFLPTLSINGQFTYQSDVTRLPIDLPNISIPEINKDQYKVYGELNQILFDGGINRNIVNASRAQATIEEKSLETELYKIKEQVNEIYFGILSLESQIKQVELLRKDIRAGLEKIEAAFANGTALKSDVDVIKAEELKIGQRTIELEAARKAYLQMLSVFINREFDERAQLEVPPQLIIKDQIIRPELDLYEARMRSLDVQLSSLKAKNLPRLNAFVQGGYGSPGLNMLDPDGDTWYIAGLRFAYPLNGLYTLKREKLINDIAKQNISMQRETFIFNTTLQTQRQLIEIEKFSDLLKTDDQLVELRESVKQASFAKLENGVITGSDYIRDIIAYDQAVQTKLLHEIQYLQAQYNHQLIIGNR
jgi:outer membrane protein TolC